MSQSPVESTVIYPRNSFHVKQNLPSQSIFLQCWLILAALSFLLAACTPAAPLDPLDGAASPEAYIIQSYAPPSYTNLVVYSKQPWQHGLLYMLGYQMETNGKSYPMLGYQLFVRSANGAGWKRTSGQGQGLAHSRADLDSPFVDEYVGIGGTNGEMDPVILYGKVLDPQVKQVNVIYKEGSHAVMIENGVFAEAAPDSSHLCGFWVLGENAQVLDRVNIAKKYQNQKQPEIAKPEECAAVDAIPPASTAMADAQAATPAPDVTPTLAAPSPTATATPGPTAADVVVRQPSHLPGPLPAELSIDIYRMPQRPIAEDRTYPQVLA